MNETLYRPTWAEVDLKALRYNFREIKKLSAGKKILAVIKADAYGHGMIKAAQILDKEGAHFFGVADIREAMAIRICGISKPILLFENTLPIFAKKIVELNLTPSVSSLALAQALNAAAGKAKRKINIHVKVDTGMGRLGVWHEDAVLFIQKIKNLKNLNVDGIMTHFACADSDAHFTKLQIQRFVDFLNALKSRGIVIPHVHAANSMGFMEYGHAYFNLVRPGLILYGLYPHTRVKNKIKLRPVLSVKSRIVFLKNVKKNRSISYGRTFIAKKNLKVATLPLGYNDGYFRAFSNNAFVLVGGKRCPVVGRVTMDQMMIDVSFVKNPKLGMEVVVLGAQGKEEISADELGFRAKTINYEITCALGNRLPRICKF